MTTKMKEKRDKESVEEREREKGERREKQRERERESPRAFYRIGNTISIRTPSCAKFTKNVAEENISRTWGEKERE